MMYNSNHTYSNKLVISYGLIFCDRLMNVNEEMGDVQRTQDVLIPKVPFTVESVPLGFLEIKPLDVTIDQDFAQMDHFATKTQNAFDCLD